MRTWFGGERFPNAPAVMQGADGRCAVAVEMSVVTR